MSEAIYFNMPHHRPSWPQGRQEPKISKTKILSNCVPEDLPSPCSWKIIAVILGIICLALLLSVGVLAIKLNQISFNAEGHPENIYIKEANKIGWKCPTCSNNWYQHGENCYLFSRNKNFWKNCLGYCSGLTSNFLKVDAEEEMNFVKTLSKMHYDTFQTKFYISLYYNNTQLKWVWLDGTDFTLNNLSIPGHENVDSKCALVKYGQIIAEDCESGGYCICKKTIYSDQVKMRTQSPSTVHRRETVSSYEDWRSVSPGHRESNTFFAASL